MGGGHVSRPDFGMPQPDPNHPLTEFYLALQHALDKEGSFALPALYAGFQAPARRVYADEAAEYLTLSSTAGEGMTRLLAPGHLQLLYSSLHVMPDGAPAALLLTEECTRTVFAVQLLHISNFFTLTLLTVFLSIFIGIRVNRISLKEKLNKGGNIFCKFFLYLRIICKIWT